MLAARTSEPCQTAAQSCRGVSLPLATILSELRSVLETLADPEYTRPMGPLFSGSTIGAHVRHCLDHVRALTDGSITGRIDYDHRDRGTPIETHRVSALEEIAALKAEVDRIAGHSAAIPVTMACIPLRDGASIALQSTLGRELAFVLSHTIHHNAQIRGMITSLGRPLPNAFGYAPSTLAHQDTGSCAR